MGSAEAGQHYLQHQRQVGEPVTPALEQTFLDLVLHEARREITFSAWFELIAQPQPLPEPPEQERSAEADAGEIAGFHVVRH